MLSSERTKTVKDENILGGPGWLELIECLTLDFSSGHDLRVVGSSLVLDSVLGEELA